MHTARMQQEPFQSFAKDQLYDFPDFREFKAQA
jgi:hypothetical protein